jgi:hypothetical protein
MLKAGDTLYLQSRTNSDKIYNYTYSTTQDCIIKFFQDSAVVRYQFFNADTTSPNGQTGQFGYDALSSGQSLHLGYKTISNTVYAPGNTVVTNTGEKTDLKAGTAVSIPISGQYSKDGTIPIYDGVDGATAGAVAGLTAKTLDGTKVGEGTTTGERTSAKDIADGIGNTLNIPKNDTPNLDFSPLFYDISKKFPFCVPFDFVNLLSPLQAPSKAPSFHVEFDSNYFYGGGSFDFDFARFDKLVKVVRYFILLAFVYYLIRKIRAFIGAGGGA